MRVLVLAGALSAIAAPWAQAAGAPAAASAVTRYDAAYFAQQRPNTAFDMIVRLPGFAFVDGAQVRGFAGAASNVLIDGDRPTSKQDNMQSILQRIRASDVDHIDLIRGGAPGIDMQGQTVVANVVRKGGSRLEGVAAVANNVFTDGRQAPAVRLEFTKRDRGKTLEGGLLAFIYVDDGVGDGHRVRTDSQGDVLIRSNLEAKAGGRQANFNTAYETPMAGGKFRMNASVFYDRYHEDDHDTLVQPVGLELLHNVKEQEKAELGVHFEKNLTPRTSIEALAIQQFHRQDYSSDFNTEGEDQLFKETDTSGESIARAILRWRKSDRFSTEVSAEGAYNIQKSDSLYAVDQANVPLPAAHVTVSEKRGEAAALATWKATSKITVEGSVRTEVSNISSSGDVVLSKTLFFPKPRLLITWSPDKDDQLRFRAEREVGQLDFTDFVASSSLGSAGGVHAGNPDIEPQDAWVLEAAYERHIKSAVAVVTFRHQEISNVVDRIAVTAPDGGVFDAPGNIGSASEDDIDANMTLPLDVFGIKHGLLKAQGNYRYSRVRDPLTGVERHISGQHRFDYEAHFTQDLPRWKSSWGVDMFNRWNETWFRVGEVDTYKLNTWLDVWIEYKPRPDLSLHFEVDNLGDRGFQRIFAVYDGARGSSALAYHDHRYEEIGPYLYFRLRKTFG
jgi:outer membrane receptor protein involved in Fe transport